MHVQKGRDIFEATSSKVRKDLKEFILNNGHIDGTALKEHWFPTINADIFLSHSHSDLEKSTMESIMAVAFFFAPRPESPVLTHFSLR